MESKRFDEIAKSVASMASRRSVVKGIIGGAFAGIVGLRGSDAAALRGAGETCRTSSQCVAGLECIVGKDGRKRCGCDGVDCDGSCCHTHCSAELACFDNAVDGKCFDNCLNSLCYGSNFNYTFNSQGQCREYCAYECLLP